MARWYHEDGRRKGSTRQWRYHRERRIQHDGRTCTVLEPGTDERCTENGRNGMTMHVHHLFDGDEIIVPIGELRTVCETHHQQLSWGGFEPEFADGPPARHRARVAA